MLLASLRADSSPTTLMAVSWAVMSCMCHIHTAASAGGLLLQLEVCLSSEQ